MKLPDRLDDIEASALLIANNGLRVWVRIETTDSGPHLVLDPVNCCLDGDQPGSYYLTSPETQ